MPQFFILFRKQLTRSAGNGQAERQGFEPWVRY